MKKTAKIILATLGCLLILFLLLPFMVPGTGRNAQADTQETAKTSVQPQIFTSNPLTKLVKSLARLFGAQKTDSPASQSAPALTEAQADARFGRELFPSEQPEPEAAEPDEETSENVENRNNQSNYTEEEWVLIPQTTPTGGASGMHEINIKDNAYDRYVKQERSARFTPAAQQPRRPEVPDSKLARLFQPIKRFLGIDTTTPVTADTDILASAKTGSTDMLGRNNSSGSNLSKFQNPTAPSVNLSVNRSGGSSSKNPVAEMMDMIFPERSIEEAADMVAKSKFPNPKDAKQQQAREALRDEKKAQYTQYVNQRLEERMLRLSEGQPAPDLMEHLLQGCQSGKSPFLSATDACNMNEEDDSSDIDALRLSNQQRFEATVGLPLPKAPITIILSRAEPEKLQESLDSLIGENAEQATTDDTELIARKYRFMLEQKNCRDKACYWISGPVPPNRPKNPDSNEQEESTAHLRQTVNGAGVEYSPYRNQKTKELNERFVQQQLALLPPQATQQERTKVENLARKTFTPYVLVDTDDLKLIQEWNKQLLKQSFSNPNIDKKNLIQEGKALYAGSAQTAWQLNQDLGEPYFFYGQKNQVLNSEANPSTADRSNQLTDDFIESAQFVKQLVQDVKGMATRESTTNYVKPMAEQFQKELNEGKKQFKKTGQTPVISLPK